MSDLDKIRKAFELLAQVAFPANYLAEAERCMVQAHCDATKAGRARELLATRGREQAAALMGCSESQVYRLAHMRIVFIPESDDFVESRAG